ncbi:MAG: hypothetical protein VYC67_04335 [Pseudomonadota bacterium]|nr:hypothetical protein [Pseudomonadota bacterium]
MRVLIYVIVVFGVLSCTATQQAAMQPIEKDLSVLLPGTQRDLVILELGAPAETRMVDGKKVDLFSFVQGYSRGTRIARVAGHASAEILTMGLWSLIGTPIEQSYNGTVMGYKVFYTADDIVERSELLVEKNRN